MCAFGCLPGGWRPHETQGLDFAATSHMAIIGRGLVGVEVYALIEQKHFDLLDVVGEQVKVEPNFSPETEAVRRAVYEAERPWVKAFEYADLPGYAVVTVDGARVTARIFAGVSRRLWRTVDLSGLLA